MISQNIKEQSFNNTIQYITEFFQQHNLIIKIDSVTESEIHTWSCTVKLFYKNNIVDHSNGKGVSKEAAIASGLGELFERFNNHSQLFKYSLFTNIWIENNQQQYGFYFDKNEQQVKYEDLFNLHTIQEYYQTLFENPIDRKDYIDTLLNHNYIAIPYTSFLDNSFQYINPILFRASNSTNGMCAGNSFYEAFVQGCSELIERHCLAKILYDWKSIKLHQLDINYITNPILQEYIKKLHKDNEIHIYDLSYNFTLPAVMIICINKWTKKITINGAAFPIFDIACERCFTEIYQNKYTLNESETLQLPFIETDNIENVALNWTNSIQEGYIFPESLILNAILEKNPSSIYLYEITNNKSFFTYYQKLFKKLHMNCYYHINQQTENLIAISLYSEELIDLTSYKIIFQKIDTVNKHRMLLLYKNKIKIIQSILKQDLCFNDIINLFPQLTNIEKSFFYTLDGGVNSLYPFTLDPYAYWIDDGFNYLLNTPLQQINIMSFYQYFKNTEMQTVITNYLLPLLYKNNIHIYSQLYHDNNPVLIQNEFHLLEQILSNDIYQHLLMYIQYIKESV